ncbi:MAG TPA: hypothetical protein VFZ01_11565, partial [Geminicoccaceae bacterium]
MRHVVAGARALPFILALLSPVVAAASDPSARSDIDLPLKEAPATVSEHVTGRLVEDDAYLRHGAITTMATCLTVADDVAATLLWSKEFHDRPEADHGLAAWLVDADQSFAEEPGFGTLLACAQIVAAWHTSLPDRRTGSETDDGRIEHGAVVIDLANAAGDPTAIRPEPLVRLLTSQGLLPPPAFGGVVIRNARIDGTLLFYNLHLNHPLTFVRTEFRGGDYPKDFLEEEPIKGTAVSIQHSRFADHIAIMSSRLCGDMLVGDSWFQETLLLSKVEQVEDGCAIATKLMIQGNRFAQGLNINRSRLEELHAASNEMDLLLMSRNQFAQRFLLESNNFGTLTLYGDGFSRSAEIKYNRIANDLFLDGTPAPSGSLIGRTETFEVTSNQIGGGLIFQDFSSSGAPEQLNFRSNHVGNGSQICLPHDWRGELKLDGSSYEGTLAVGLRYPQGVEPPYGEVERDPPCHGPFFIDRERAANPFAGNTYCEPVDERTGRNVLIDLTATEIRTLQWHLPFNCTYRWSGFGLTYDLWMPPGRAKADFASKGEKWHEAAFNAWRTTLKSYQPASLDMMSRYFADKGEHVASRDLQVEAKRLNYAPECAPSDDLLSCMGQVIGKPAAPGVQFAGRAYAATDLGGDAWDEPLVDRIWRAFKLVLLWPGGFGAKPERAILLLMGGAIGFGALYWVYIRCMRLRFAVLVHRFITMRHALPPGDADRPELFRIVRDFIQLVRTSEHNEVAESTRAELLPRVQALAQRRASRQNEEFERTRLWPAVRGLIRTVLLQVRAP